MRRYIVFVGMVCLVCLVGCQGNAPVSYEQPSADQVLAGQLAKPATQRFNYFLNATGAFPAVQSASPAMAKASNGDVVMLWGQGELTTGQKSVNGSGTYTHTDANGNVLVQGVWLSEQLISFKSFGAEPGDPDSWTGGVATIRAWTSGGWQNAVITLTCTRGDSPKRSSEGVTMTFQGGPRFTEAVDGHPLFVLEQ